MYIVIQTSLKNLPPLTAVSNLTNVTGVRGEKVIRDAKKTPPHCLLFKYFPRSTKFALFVHANLRENTGRQQF